MLRTTPRTDGLKDGGIFNTIYPDRVVPVRTFRGYDMVMTPLTGRSEVYGDDPISYLPSVLTGTTDWSTSDRHNVVLF